MGKTFTDSSDGEGGKKTPWKPRKYRKPKRLTIRRRRRHVKWDASKKFIVEKILDVKLENGEAKYLIKWKNYGVKSSTWEPKEHLLPDCLDLISDFLDIKLGEGESGSQVTLTDQNVSGQNNSDQNASDGNAPGQNNSDGNAHGQNNSDGNVSAQYEYDQDKIEPALLCNEQLVSSDSEVQEIQDLREQTPTMQSPQQSQTSTQPPRTMNDMLKLLLSMDNVFLDIPPGKILVRITQAVYFGYFLLHQVELVGSVRSGGGGNNAQSNEQSRIKCFILGSTMAKKYPHQLIQFYESITNFIDPIVETVEPVEDDSLQVETAHDSLQVTIETGEEDSFQGETAETGVEVDDSLQGETVEPGGFQDQSQNQEEKDSESHSATAN